MATAVYYSHKHEIAELDTEFESRVEECHMDTEEYYGGQQDVFSKCPVSECFSLRNTTDCTYFVLFYSIRKLQCIVFLRKYATYKSQIILQFFTYGLCLGRDKIGHPQLHN